MPGSVDLPPPLWGRVGVGGKRRLRDFERKAVPAARRGRHMIPGELFVAAGDIALNEGRETVTITVANTGDRPIQVGSHYHFH